MKLTLVAVMVASTLTAFQQASSAAAPLLLQGHISVSQGVTIGSRVVQNVGSERTGAGVGSRVEVIWYPGLETAKAGDEIIPVVVARTTADSSGNYRIGFKPTADMTARAKRNDGWVNFDVNAVTPAGEIASNTVTRSWTGSSWSGKQYDDQNPSASIRSSVVYAGSKLITGTKISSTAAAAATGPIYCSYVIDSTRRDSVRVMSFHNGSNADGTWGYGRTADSNIEAGTSPWGSGRWTVSGSYHVGNTMGSNATGTTSGTYNRFTRTDFRFALGHVKIGQGSGKVGDLCTGSATMRVGDRHVNPQTWAGGVADDGGSGSGQLSCLTAPRKSYRGSYPAGTSLTKSSSKATKVSFAVSLGYINLGGQSGYSTNVTMKWESKRRTGIWLCGQTGDETGNAGVIYAQNK